MRRPPDYIVCLRADRARQAYIAALVAALAELERFSEAVIERQMAYLRRGL